MILPASYSNGFAPRDGMSLYPELWPSTITAAINPGLGPTGSVIRDWRGTNYATFNSGIGMGPVGGINAASFNGTNFLQLPLSASTSVFTTGSIFLSCWLYLNSLSVDAYAFGKRPVANNAGFILVINATSGTVFCRVFYSGSNANSTSTNAVTSGKWFHLAMSNDSNGDKKTRIYINGIETAYSSQTAGTGSVSDDTGTPICIGKDGAFSSTNGLFPGGVTDIVIARSMNVRLLPKMAIRPGIAYEMQDRRWVRQIQATTSGYSVFKSSIIRASA